MATKSKAAAKQKVVPTVKTAVSGIRVEPMPIADTTGKFADVFKGADVLPSERIAFHLSGPQSIANALRHAIIDETPSRCLKFDADKFSSDDDYLHYEIVNERIGLIAVRQDIPDSVTFRIDVANTGTDHMIVTSGMLQPSVKLDRPACRPTVRICALQPNRHLRIDGIHFYSGTGMEHARFSQVAAHTFMVTDVVPLTVVDDPADEKTESKTYGVSSLESQYYERDMGFETNGNVDSKRLVSDACGCVLSRLERVRDLVVGYDQNANTTILKERGDLVILTETDITLYLIRGEMYAMGYMLQQIALEIDPSITMVNYKITHPQREEVTLRIRHPKPNDIVLEAVRRATTAFTNIQSQFGGPYKQEKAKEVKRVAKAKAK